MEPLGISFSLKTLLKNYRNTKDIVSWESLAISAQGNKQKTRKRASYGEELLFGRWGAASVMVWLLNIGLQSKVRTDNYIETFNSSLGENFNYIIV